MYSLISSLVVMRDCEAGVLAGTFAHASRFKYGQFRRQMGLRAVQKRFARVSVARTFVVRASPVKCDSVAHIKRLHVKSGLSSPRRPYEWSYGRSKHGKTTMRALEACNGAFFLVFLL